MEDLYFGRNAHTAFAVGRPAGWCCSPRAWPASPASRTRRRRKQAVCGSGSAGKGQVQRMVGALLSLAEPPRPDHAADALAVAICHANGASLKEALG